MTLKAFWNHMFTNDSVHKQKNRDSREILQLQVKAKEIRQKSEELLAITERIVYASRGGE